MDANISGFSVFNESWHCEVDQLDGCIVADQNIESVNVQFLIRNKSVFSDVKQLFIYYLTNELNDKQNNNGRKQKSLF